MQKEKEILREYLQGIKNRQYLINENDDVIMYSRLMIKYIGDVDPKLRDDLIFEAFYYWIKEYEFFSQDALEDLIFMLIDENHLFNNIGFKESDSVFTRSFSMLVLSIILSYQKEKHLFDQQLLVTVKNALIKYCKLERDFRGYVNEKGWAHSAAHVADAFNELAQCNESNEEMHKEILEAIEKVIFNNTYKLCFKEDDRVARVVYSIYNKEFIERTVIMEWLSDLVKKCDFSNNQEAYISSLNFRNFNRSFYFNLLHLNSDSEILNAVSKIDANLNSINH